MQDETEAQRGERFPRGHTPSCPSSHLAAFLRGLKGKLAFVPSCDRPHSLLPRPSPTRALWHHQLLPGGEDLWASYRRAEASNSGRKVPLAPSCVGPSAS